MSSRRILHFFTWMAGDGHSSTLCWMLQLAMATAGSDNHPAVGARTIQYVARAAAVQSGRPIVA
jgi:hypothetical protein